MYCGNDVLNNNSGTRFKCLKKGIGVAMASKSIYLNNLPRPVTGNNFYCGEGLNFDKNKYDRPGNLAECLRKGFGVGKQLNTAKKTSQLIKDIDSILSGHIFNRNLEKGILILCLVYLIINI